MLPADVLKQIVAKTDGNPLFVEELTKAVLEAGILVEDAKSYRLDGPLPPLAIPATLQSVSSNDCRQMAAALPPEMPHWCRVASQFESTSELLLLARNSRQAESNNFIKSVLGR